MDANLLSVKAMNDEAGKKDGIKRPELECLLGSFADLLDVQSEHIDSIYGKLEVLYQRPEFTPRDDNRVTGKSHYGTLKEMFVRLQENNDKLENIYRTFSEFV